MTRIPCARGAGLTLFAIGWLGLIAALFGSLHAHAPEAVQAPAGISSPRVTATSETFELVGILKNGQLAIYLDRMEDLSPVTDARVEVSIDGASVVAEPRPDGTYVLKWPAVEKAGEHEIVVSVAAGAVTDLLVGSLTTAPAAHDHAGDKPSGAAGTSPQRSAVARVAGWFGIEAGTLAATLRQPWMIAAGALALVALAWLLAKARRSAAATGAGATTALLLAAALLGGGAEAGPGHEGEHDHAHGHDGPAAGGNGDAPRRLPDGALFLPKPTQRLLDIRTRVVSAETARATHALIGRVIADPNHSGLVQSTITGRIRPPKGGLPVLGQGVKAGEVLAFVEPAFAPIDASDVRQTAGDLEQRAAVLRARINRQKQLVDKQVASRASLEDLEIELEGLEARRAELQRSRSQPEPLTSPADGVVAEMRAAAGQVVTSTDVLFHIVDTKRLWVEAIAFDNAVAAETSRADARTPDGTRMALSFVGRSRSLQQQATILQYRIDEPPQSLSIAAPVRVAIENGKEVSGLILPRKALAQAPNGQTVVFKRIEPERYLPAPVRFEDIDGERVHVLDGLAAGDRIIVRNAPLVNQIR